MSAISETPTTPSTRHFIFRRIHSLVGVLPLGAFLVDRSPVMGFRVSAGSR